MTLWEVFKAEAEGVVVRPVEPKGKNPLDDLFTPQEAAREKNVSATAVARAIQEGRLAAWKKGPVYLIPRRELDRWEPVRGRGRRKKTE